MPPPRMHSREGVPRDRRRAPHRVGAAEFGVEAGEPKVDFAVSQRRKQQVVDQLFKGLAGLMKGRGITTFAGTGTLGPDHVVKVAVARGRCEMVGRARGARLRFGAADDSRVRDRR